MRANLPATGVVLLLVVAVAGLGVLPAWSPAGDVPVGQPTTALGEAGATIAGGPSTGESVATGDVNGDGATDVVVGVPFDDAGGTNAGAAYLFLGPVRGDHRLGDADAALVGARPGDWAGFAVAAVDVDGDGRDEVVVGAPLRDGGAGGVYFVDAPAGTVALGDAPLVPGPADGQFGRAVAGAGDLTGGTGADVLAGAPGAGDAAGAVYLLSDATFEAGSVTAAAATYRGAAAGDRAGWAVAGGDVDGDGRPEAVVGARSAGDGVGAVYVLDGAGGTGSTSLADAAAVVAGPPGGSAGWAVATGDVDGDGVADVLVGAPTAGPGGAAYVVGGALPGRVALGDATPVFAGRTAGDRAGWAVAVGDCDGRAHVLVGAPRADAAGPDAGAVYRVGPDGTEAATYAGEAAGDYAGYRLATGGDVTGDGRWDAVVGAPGNESSGETGAGSTAAAYVVAGDCVVGTPNATSSGGPGTASGGSRTASGGPGTAATGSGTVATSPETTPTEGTADPARTRGLPAAGVAVAALALVVAAGLVARRRGRRERP